MGEVTKMDRAAVKQINAALERAAEEVADQFGLNVKVGGGRFDPTVGTFQPKVEFSVEGSAEREFAELAPMFGLGPDDHGRLIAWGDRNFRLVGFKPRSPKYPIIAEDEVSGKRYKLPESAVEAIRSEHESARAKQLGEEIAGTIKEGA